MYFCICMKYPHLNFLSRKSRRIQIMLTQWFKLPCILSTQLVWESWDEFRASNPTQSSISPPSFCFYKAYERLKTNKKRISLWMGIDCLIVFLLCVSFAFKTMFRFYLFQSNLHADFVQLCSTSRLILTKRIVFCPLLLAPSLDPQRLTFLILFAIFSDTYFNISHKCTKIFVFIYLDIIYYFPIIVDED